MGEVRDRWLGAVAFGFFVLWLLALPMEGELLVKFNPPKGFYSLFLFSHLVGTLLVALYLYRFPKALKFSALITALLTGTLPFLRELHLLTAGALGLFSGVLSAFVASSLGRFKSPTAVAAGGLTAGNALLVLLLSTLKKFPYLASPLAVLVGALLLTALLLPQPKTSGGEEKVKRGAPLVFLIYLLLGNSYLYLHFKSPAGLDNLIYALAVLGALYLTKRREELLLPATVLLLGLSAVAVSLEGGLVSLALVQTSAGLADLFVLNLLFTSGSSLRGAGILVGAMVGGIFAGLPFRTLLGGWSSWVLLLGNFAISALFAISYASLKKRPKLEEELKGLGLSRESFSKREWQVLKGVYRGKSLKAIAQEIGISESSVKTYLGRVYRKVGVGGKRELLEKLRSSQK